MTILIYGPPKVGKTTLGAAFPGALLVATEPGHNCISGYVAEIGKWEDLGKLYQELVADLKTGKSRFKTVVIDTVGNLQMFCEAAICAEFKVAHLNDLAYGKGSALLKSKLQMMLTMFAQLDTGLVLIAHKRDRTIESPAGKYDRAEPLLNDRIREVVEGLADMILFADFETVRPTPDAPARTRRVLRTKPAREWIAGDRLVSLGHGGLPPVIDIDSETNAFPAFARAFDAAVGPAPAVAAAAKPAQPSSAPAASAAAAPKA
jgi:hypothetical protein